MIGEYKELHKHRLNFLLKNPFSLFRKEDANSLAKIIEKYPYFQTARVLYLKNIKNLEASNYLSELSTTAIYCVKRSVLFNYMRYITVKKNSPKILLKTRRYKLHEWLSLDKNSSCGKKIPLSEEGEGLDKLEIIDNFLLNYLNNSESSLKKTSLIDDKSLPVESYEIIKSEDIVTETLAQIYLNQKKYKKAIKAYQTLLDKYPEKNDFFASRIQFIEEIQLTNLN